MVVCGLKVSISAPPLYGPRVVFKILAAGFNFSVCRYAGMIT